MLTKLSLFISLLFLSQQSNEWIPLVKDNTLSGWKPLNGEWIIEDGIIRGTLKKKEQDFNKAVSTWLMYEEKEFADFELELEFRTPRPINGGVQFRTHWLPLLPVPENAKPEEIVYDCYGYQANIETRVRKATGGIMDENGRGLLAEPSDESVKTLSQKNWNKMRIEAVGSKIRVFLHDILSAEIEDDKFIKGYIFLQVRADEVIKDEPVFVEYRNIRIKDLGRTGNWVNLFNGINLDGWKNYGSEEWVVENGVIVGKSGPKKSEGYLATEKTWKDFHARAQFKMLGEGNYGFFYHSSITMREDGYPIISGVQVEVEPGYPTKTGWIYESYKRGWLVEPNTKNPSAWCLRKNDWNEIEVKCVGNKTTTWLNGIKVIEFEDPAPNLLEGFFALQLHTGGVAGIMWKEIYVLE
ncbi:MAG: DUF1080 domain-containing protein [Candidatus Hydrogenedentes bacterium]|nr:DUF1080 domain-containing protein [Candidatus Hydrogenedentota bacterium]